MKKFVIIAISFLATLTLIPVGKVKAEDVNNQPETAEITEEGITNKVKDFLGQYMDASLVAQIITWLVDAGVLTALLGIAVKYGKYKKSTVEDVIGTVKSEVGKYLKESFNDLSNSEVANIINKVGDLEKSMEVIMKVLVLMQDSSTKGKAALIDFLGSKTESKEIKETAEDVKTTLAIEEKVEEEVLEKVSNDYKDIF